MPGKDKPKKQQQAEDPNAPEVESDDDETDGQQQQQTAEVAQPEIVHMKTIISQQEHSNLPQQGGSEQLFVQTNLSPEKLEVEQILREMKSPSEQAKANFLQDYYVINFTSPVG